jgi:hypothetical protein
LVRLVRPGALVAPALLASIAAVARADLVDYEILDLEIRNHQNNACANVPFVNQPTCILLTVRSNGPSAGSQQCGATVRFQDPAGEVVIVEFLSVTVFGQPMTITLANHSYQPTQIGMFSVSCSLRPPDQDTDVNPANNNRTETYEVVAGEPSFACTYEPGVREIRYGVSGAPTGAVYTVAGAASLPVGFAGPLPDLVGPVDAASVVMACLGEGNGTVTVTIRAGQTVVHQCAFCLECAGAGADPSVPCHFEQPPLPAGGLLFVIALAAILLAVAAWRRRAAGR